MIAAIYAGKSTEETGVSEDLKSGTRQIEHAKDYAKGKAGASLRSTSTRTMGSPVRSS